MYIGHLFLRKGLCQFVGSLNRGLYALHTIPFHAPVVLRSEIHLAFEDHPDNAALHHAHGLALVRLERADEGLAALGRAYELAPEQPRYAYVLGVAMFREQPGEAITLLREAHERFPGRHDLLLALATMSRDVGEFAAARSYAEKLRAVSPTSQAARELLDTLPR